MSIQVEIPTDEQLEELASNYVIEVYAPVGDASYIYEDWRDPSNDTTAKSVTESMPRSDHKYVCSCKILDVEIVSTNVTSRDNEAQEYIVEVELLARIKYSEDDDDDDELNDPQLRKVCCYVEWHGEYIVSNAEE